MVEGLEELRTTPRRSMMRLMMRLLVWQHAKGTGRDCMRIWYDWINEKGETETPGQIQIWTSISPAYGSIIWR